MTTRFDKVLALGALAVVLAFAVAAQFLQPPEDSIAGSAASADPQGRRALLLLLRDLGLQAEAWSDAPGVLPRDGALVWVARPPRARGAREDAESDAAADPETEAGGGEPDGADPDAGETDAGEKGGGVERADTELDRAETDGAEAGPSGGAPKRAPSPAELGVRALGHYRRFVEDGGTLVVPYSDDARAFLVDELGFEACADIRSVPEAAAGARSFRDLRGEVLDIDVEKGGVLVPPPSGSSASASWWSEREDGELGDVLAAVVPAGSGQVVILGSDAFLDNEKIGERDHALFALRLAGEFAHGRRVLFDEYALGVWHPRTVVSFLSSPNLFLASLHLLALLLLFVWRSAWVREFQRDPVEHAAVAPLERARALAALLARSGRRDLLARLAARSAADRSSRTRPPLTRVPAVTDRAGSAG